MIECQFISFLCCLFYWLSYRALRLIYMLRFVGPNSSRILKSQFWLCELLARFACFIWITWMKSARFVKSVGTHRFVKCDATHRFLAFPFTKKLEPTRKILCGCHEYFYRKIRFRNPNSESGWHVAWNHGRLQSNEFVRFPIYPSRKKIGPKNQSCKSAFRIYIFC